MSPESVRRTFAQHAERDDRTIGTARMEDDGTIVLDLRAEGPGGIEGDAQEIYPPHHKDYAEILRHLGGLQPGETKFVPPWKE